MIKFSIAIAFLLLHQLGFAQFDIPKKPSFQTSVYDYANLLNSAEKQQLEDKLVRYSDSTTTQIVVITIEDLKGEDIGILTPKWAHEWGIGQAKEDNGVLVLLSKNDRKIWIAPGYGVEDRLTAGINGELVRNIIIPEFKAGSYYNGLDKGADAIFDVLKGKYKGERKSDKSTGGGKIIFFIIIFIIIIAILSRNKRGGGGNSGRFSGPDLGDIIILSSLGRGGFGGFGGGGSSGGGFGGGGFGGGFGGGGFSGGGAGGSW
ncbi:MAG TPA: TPM domain-containing protein [Flavobacterium sp.]|uniref:TPM domain-containing protein n=1 Tax=Flavobacterium sp. TaxID=239 RepID=UPI002C6721BC|nr:TPM domain-containing protein [Flavobacterium sp.]HSD14896.1 TPM domain-containing protein [Flavobacterium sp.]